MTKDSGDERLGPTVFILPQVDRLYNYIILVPDSMRLSATAQYRSDTLHAAAAIMILVSRNTQIDQGQHEDGKTLAVQDM